GCDEPAAGIDDLVACLRRAFADLHHPPCDAAEQPSAHPVGSDQPAAGDRQGTRLLHPQPSTPRALRVSTSRQAMRIATPISTCSVMIDPGMSATLLSISTPRFIGPGCMTIASGAARASRSGVRP